MAVIPQAGEVFHSEDGTISVVLPDTCDPHAEPTQEELEEYAAWLGVRVAEEPHLLWVAREGLLTPLPPEWKACRTGEGEVYYFNFCTGESSWDHPLDEVFKRKLEEERAKGGSHNSNNNNNNSLSGEHKGKKHCKSSTASSNNNSSNINNTLLSSSGKGKEGKRLEKGAAGNIEIAQTSGKNNNNTSPSTSPTTMGLQMSNMRFGRLGALGTPEAAQRVTPDVSEILLTSNKTDRGNSRFSLGINTTGVSGNNNNNNNNNSGLMLGNTLGAGAPVSGILPSTNINNINMMNSVLGINSGRQTKPLDGVKGMEANIRQRIEDDIDAKRRAMRIKHEKQISQEKIEMEAKIQKIKEENEKEIALLRQTQKQEEEKQEKANVEKEAKEKLLEKEYKETEERVAVLRNQIQRERTVLESTLQRLVMEAKEKLQATHSDSIKKQQAASAASLEKERAKLMEEYSKQLEEEAKRTSLNNKTSITTHEKKIDAMRGQVERELALKREKALTIYNNNNNNKEEEDSENVVKAQRAYDGAIKEASTKAANDLEAIRLEYNIKEKKLQEAKEQKLKEKNNNNTNSTQTAVAEEEARLKNELSEKTKRYSEETQRLVTAKKEKLQTQQLSSSSNNNNNNSIQEQRRFELALRQLDTKHNQAMENIRAQHQTKLREGKFIDIRQNTKYREKLREKQQAWIKAHPQPTLLMPKLEIIPTITLGLMSAPPTPLLSEEEQKKYISNAVNKAKEIYLQEHEQELTKMEETLVKERKNNVETYRTKRLAEVQVQLEKFRNSQIEIHQRKLNEISETFKEESKLKLKSTLPPTIDLDSKITSSTPEISLLGVNEISTEEANKKTEELRKRLQTRIETLQLTLQHAKNELRLRREEFEMKSLLSTGVHSSLPISWQKPPPAPTTISLLSSGRQDQFSTPRPQQISQQNQQIQNQQFPHSFSTPVLNHTLSTIPPVNSLWSSARPSPTRQLHSIELNPMISAFPYYNNNNNNNNNNNKNTNNNGIGLQHRSGIINSANDNNILLLQQQQQQQQQQQDIIFEDRLHRAMLLLHEKKENLRNQQHRMKHTRNLWLQDMEDCRKRHNREHAIMLREIKIALEEKARQLNSEVLDLKQAAAWLQNREMLYKQSRGIQSKMPKNYNTNTGGNSVNGSHLIGLLESMLARTSLLETYINSPKKTRKTLHIRQHHSLSPHKHHHSQQQNQNHINNNNNNNNNNHHHDSSRRNKDTRALWSDATPSGITRWLSEQQFVP